MLRFFLRRLGFSVITLLILIVIVFFLTYVFPKDVARELAPPFSPPERIEEIRTEFGLDDPKTEQLGRVFKGVLTLDFGESWTRRVPVKDLVVPAVWNSFKLVIFALALTIPISILGGVIAARKKDTAIDRGIVTFGLASASIPDFVSGVFLQYLLGVQLDLFPASTRFTDDDGFFGTLNQMVLPALAIVAVYFGYIARITRAGTITALESDYTRTAYMKGLNTNTVVRKHVLRNSLQPTVTVTATQMGYLFGGLVGLERVFNYPGLGRLILSAAEGPDIPLLQACVLTVAVIFMASTFISDLLIAWMNPRARSSIGQG